MTILDAKAAQDKFVPTRADQLDISGFVSWLAKCGAAVGVPTNPYEMCRYKVYDFRGHMATHIVYRKDRGTITWTGNSFGHYQRFINGNSLPPQTEGEPDGLPRLRTPPSAKRNRGEITRERLLDRDGDECWFCGTAMGLDTTIEHLVPKSAGGRNMLANYALAHQKCNARAANLPLVKKIELRQKMRQA